MLEGLKIVTVVTAPRVVTAHMLATVVATKNVIRNIFFVSALVRMIDPLIAYSSRANEKVVCPNNECKQPFEILVD